MCVPQPKLLGEASKRRLYQQEGAGFMWGECVAKDLVAHLT